MSPRRSGLVGSPVGSRLECVTSPLVASLGGVALAHGASSEVSAPAPSWNSKSAVKTQQCGTDSRLVEHGRLNSRVLQSPPESSRLLQQSSPKSFKISSVLLVHNATGFPKFWKTGIGNENYENFGIFSVT